MTGGQWLTSCSLVFLSTHGMHWIPELMIQLYIDDGAGQQAICGIYHSKITYVVYIDTTYSCM